MRTYSVDDKWPGHRVETLLKIPCFLYLAVLLLCSAGLLSAQSAVSIDTRASEILFESINVFRQQEGLRQLKTEPASEKAAYAHSLELADRRVLSHQGRDGARVAERYRTQGGSGLKAGEILGAADTPAAILEAWKLSPSHRQVMLGEQWWNMGISSIRLDAGRLLVVIVFSDSRWRQKSISWTDEGIVLEGWVFFDNPENPPDFTLFLSERFHHALEIREVDGIGSQVRFLIENQGNDSILSGKLLFRENGGVDESDLILLEKPVSD